MHEALHLLACTVAAGPQPARRSMFVHDWVCVCVCACTCVLFKFFSAQVARAWGCNRQWGNCRSRRRFVFFRALACQGPKSWQGQASLDRSHLLGSADGSFYRVGFRRRPVRSIALEGASPGSASLRSLFGNVTLCRRSLWRGLRSVEYSMAASARHSTSDSMLDANLSASVVISIKTERIMKLMRCIMLVTRGYRPAAAMECGALVASYVQHSLRHARLARPACDVPSLRTFRFAPRRNVAPVV